MREFTCCFAPVLALVLGGVGLLASVAGIRGLEELRARRQRIGRLFLATAGALVLVFLGAVGVECEPYCMPERYIPTLERTSAPLIEALDRYTQERGEAPMVLEQLVPEYMAAIPSTGYRGDQTFGYYRWFQSGTDWELYVFCEPPALSITGGDELLFSSATRRWRWTRGG